jgi:D-alanine transaminase
MLPAGQATVSVLDRGFIFGDGVYEVIPVFGSHVLRLAEHLRRLAASLEAIGIPNPHHDPRWEEIVRALLEQNPGAEDRAVYLQVTRGVAPREHVSGAVMTPTVFGMCNPIPARAVEQGLTAITHEDIRWQYCHIKAISLLPNVLLKERARRQGGATEAILLRGDRVTEGAASNVFVVHGNTVRTPRKDIHLLPGVTRDLLVELLRNAGQPCQETDVTRGDLFTAGEIWLTSSMMGVAPVTRLDGRPVGAGTPGPAWTRVNALYQDFKRHSRR